MTSSPPSWPDAGRPRSGPTRQTSATWPDTSGHPTPCAAVELLLASGAGHANAVVLGFRADMTEAGLSPATIGRKLAAVRSVVKLARTLGWVAWAIDIPSPRAERHRDTRGPGRDGWMAMLAEARGRSVFEARQEGPRPGPPPPRQRPPPVRGRRTRPGRRRPPGTDRRHRRQGQGGAGKLESPSTTRPPTPWPAGSPCGAAGPAPPVRLDRAAGTGQPARLDDNYVARVTHGLGRRAGIARGTNPHGLRHEGITRALDLADGDVRKVREISRHAKVETLLKYDDNRAHEAGRIARSLGDDAD